MKGCSKTAMWLVLWPFLLPFWLWKKGKIGSALAGIYVLFVLFVVVVAATPTPEAQPSEEAGAPQLLAQIDTPAPTATATTAPPTETATSEPTATSVPATDTATSRPPTETFTPEPPTATFTPAPPTATFTPLPPTNTPLPIATFTPVPVGPVLPSNGIGITRAAWEEEHGTGVGDFGTSYENNRYWVLFYEGRINHLEVSLPQPVSRSDAQVLAKQFMPADAERVDVIQDDAERYIEHWFSQALAESYPDGLYIEGAPGDFIVLYRLYEGTVSSYIVGTGLNP